MEKQNHHTNDSHVRFRKLRLDIAKRSFSSDYSYSKDVSEIMASSDIGDWYRGIPQISRYWFTASVVVPIVARIGLLNPMWLILTFQHFIYKFQVRLDLFYS